MVAEHARGAHLIVIAVAMTGLAVVHVEAGHDRDSARPVESRVSGGAANLDAHQRWPRVYLPHPFARQALIDALDTAAMRLELPACADVLHDFAAFTTRDLGDRLVSLGTSLQRYLAILVFIDDSRHRLCLGGALAMTTPGSRVVRVCADALTRSSVDRERVVAMVIHETLHTLGLPENPPSSRDITKRVLARCGSTK